MGFMRNIVSRMDGMLYAKFQDNWDNRFFRQVIMNRLRNSDHVLDVGAGAGIVEQMHFRGHAAHVAGVDLDERVLKNPHLDDARVGNAERMPFDDESFDLVFSNNVLEHLEAPEVVFCEVARLLKPGGIFLAKTPNRWHYVPLIASCTPHFFHEWVNKRRGRNAEDTFPTRYLVNTRRDITRYAREAGMEVQKVQLIEGRPEYLRHNPLTYFAGTLYERVVNHVPGLDGFRVVLVATLQKPTRTISRRNSVKAA